MRRTAVALAYWLVLEITAAPNASLALSARAQTKDAPYNNEAAARACVHKRLPELLAQNRPNIAGDAALAECTKGMQAELKERKKSYCEAVSYIGWLVADENSKINGLQGQAYRPDSAAIQRCEKSNTWEKHQ
jgi:hypothetical protein